MTAAKGAGKAKSSAAKAASDKASKATPRETKADATPAGSGGKPEGTKAAVAQGKAAAKPRQVTKRGDQAPEAKRTPAEKSKAAQKLFDDADKAALAGLPPDMTVEQHANHVRRSALGY